MSSHLTRQIRHHQAHSLIGLVGLSAGTAAMVGAVLAGLPAVTLAPGVVTTAIGAAYHQHHLNRRRRWAAGARTEARVQAALNQINGITVAHNVDLDGIDADHLITHPRPIVIETKSGQGPVTATADGHLQIGTRQIPGRPVNQAHAIARQVRARTGQYTQVIICVPDATGRPTDDGRGGIICNLDQLPATISHLLTNPTRPAPSRRPAR